MRFECFNAWDQLPASSDSLFAETEIDSVFLSREWFKGITKLIISDQQDLLLACVITKDVVTKEEKLLAVLPLLTNLNKEWSSFCHPYSALFSILLADKQKKEILKCLCQGLKELPFDYLSITPIADDDNNLRQFQNAMTLAEMDCHRNHKAYNWFHRSKSHEHGHDYKAYMAERPSKIRNTIERKQRKFKREKSYKVQLYIDKDVEQALTDYHQIYKVSWKANEQAENLVEDVIKRLSQRGWPRLAIMTVNDKPIAAQLWFVVEGKASIFRLAYDESWKHYSPGSVLMSYLLEYVIDIDKVKEIDFLSGNDAYKKDWMSERRERFTLVFVKKPKENTEPSLSVLTKIFRFLSK